MKDFDEWIASKWLLEPLVVRGHKFEKTTTGGIRIDNGLFQTEEAAAIADMLVSRNPITRISATVSIWERNGTLRTIVLVIAILILILIVIRVRR